MKTPDGAIFYTGFGWLEGTNLSMGRGTEIPFEILGAPWIDGFKLAAQMNNYDLQGIKFTPWSFVPNQRDFRYYKQHCQGVRAVLTDRNRFDCFLTGLFLVKTIWELYPQKYQFLPHFKILFGNAEVESWIKTGLTPEEIKNRFKPEIDKFLLTRKKYLLYH